MSEIVVPLSEIVHSLSQAQLPEIAAVVGSTFVSEKVSA